MKTVYIETTIPSYYFETRKSATAVAWRAATRDWWDHHRHDYRLYLSRFVREEMARAPRIKGKQMARLVEGVHELEEPQGLQGVVRTYVDHHVMPAEAGGDAYHLAMASMHAVQFLLTWNCRHLANANKIQHIDIVNRRLGLHTPIITTPLTLIPEATA